VDVVAPKAAVSTEVADCGAAHPGQNRTEPLYGREQDGQAGIGGERSYLIVLKV
jgi:hypothetical protein